MFQEVEKLQYLENTTLSSDLAQGFALKALTGMQVRLWILKVYHHFFETIFFTRDMLLEERIFPQKTAKYHNLYTPRNNYCKSSHALNSRTEKDIYNTFIILKGLLSGDLWLIFSM